MTCEEEVSTLASVGPSTVTSAFHEASTLASIGPSTVASGFPVFLLPEENGGGDDAEDGEAAGAVLLSPKEGRSNDVGGGGATDKMSYGERSTCRRWTRFASTLLFVVGSALYLAMAVTDMKWAVESNATTLAEEEGATRTSGAIIGVRRLRSAHREMTNEDEWWTDLPENIQDAYEALGYDEELWEEGEHSSIGDLEWDALTDEQREAAIFVGYDEDLWNADVEFTTPTILPYKPGIAEADNSSAASASFETQGIPRWFDLTQRQRYDLLILGHTETSWNGGEKAPIEDKSWTELSDTETEVLVYFGYDAASWDATPPGERFGLVASGGIAEGEVDEAIAQVRIHLCHCSAPFSMSCVRGAGSWFSAQGAIGDQNATYPRDSIA